MTKSECNLKEISNGLHRDQTRLSVSCRGFAIPRCSLLASCNRMQRSTACCLFIVSACSVISHYFCLATAHAAVSALLSGHCYLPCKYLSVLVWPLLPTHCRCRDYCCTWSHSVTHTHSLGLIWTRDWPVAGTSATCATHNIHKRQTSMPPAGFEPAIPTSERPQTHALHGADTGIGFVNITVYNILKLPSCIITINTGIMKIWIASKHYRKTSISLSVA